MKEVVRRACVDPDGITAFGGLNARKISVATWHSIPKKPSGHSLERQNSKHPEGSNTLTQRM
jgi:hypothetical protein